MMAESKSDPKAAKPGPRQMPDGTPVAVRSEKQLSMRRSQRVYMRTSVVMYGRGENGRIFAEETFSVIVSAHGAMVLMATPVKAQQRLFLMNVRTEEDVECYVATVGKQEEGKYEIGIGFVAPAPNFWQLSFPPEDWGTQQRKRPEASA
jgi:hypothetical protein